MIKLTEPYPYQITSMFNAYTHNIAVIHSVLERQYQGQLFVDSEKVPQIAMLFTPFAFHFVAGNSEMDDVIDVIDELLFSEYLLKSGEKEAVVFCPDSKWDIILDEVFRKHRGIKDKRKIYKLNKDKFLNVVAERKRITDADNKLVYEQDRGSEKQYPVSRVFRGNECVSFCSGFMLGNGHAEIDVFTDEAFRGRGYAKEAAITLIEKLLSDGIEPDWCTWPYRVESQKLAHSLGYELLDEVSAHIWVEAHCGSIKQ